jgi:hypothetical protein
LVLLLIGLCPPTTPAADLEYDRATDFTGYRTYAWKEGTPAYRPSMQEMIVQTIDRGLQSKGLVPVDEDPDLWVVTYILVDRHTLEELSDPVKFEFWTGVTSVDAYELQAGSLLLDLIDADSDRVVWRCLASGKVKGSAKKMQKKIPKMIGNMLRGYPPAPPQGD